MGEGAAVVVPRRADGLPPNPSPPACLAAGRKRGRPRHDQYSTLNGARLAIRDYILALAIERFGCSGFHVVGIQALLSGTDISKPELYRHFCSKDRLIAACVLEDSDRVARRIDDAGWQTSKRACALFSAC